MESNRAVIGALILIILIIGSNFVMYVIARNWAKGGDSPWMAALKKSLGKPLNDNPANKSMEELRKRVDDLEKKKNGE